MMATPPNTLSETKESYLAKRERLVSQEMHARTGGDLKLSARETLVNSFLMKEKLNVINDSRQNEDGKDFPPAMHFFHAKPLLEQSTVFKLIRTMPKGAALHIHDLALVDMHWVIKTFTYRPDCYMCVDKDGVVLFHFFEEETPSESFLKRYEESTNKCSKMSEFFLKMRLQQAKDCKWKLVVDERKKDGNPERFDEYLYRNMTMITDNPEEVYTSEGKIWNKFNSCFGSLVGLLTYKPVFTEFFTQALQEFYDDNVQMMEIRALLLPTYDLKGEVNDELSVLQEMERISATFQKNNPDFKGAKIIFNLPRLTEKEIVKAAINTSMTLKKEAPDTFLGFDLVAHEDDGRTLLYFLDELLYPSQVGSDLKFFFHAGETNWIGQDVDLNLLDALLLNTTRIGHGYAITKHPEAMKMAIEKDIPLEVNPISNQVLGLVSDLRNHPAANLMASGFPLVISSDDPGLFGASGLSHDFYEAFMGLGGAWADLATLKQLAMDSIKYSAVNQEEKKPLLEQWTTNWETFIEKTICNYNLS